MKFVITVLTICLVLVLKGNAQYNPQDCKDAKPICTTLDSTSISYIGYGNFDEINDSVSCLQDGERNSVWYVFNVQSDGLVGFLIKPKVETDDYDWAVYNITDANCSDIYSNPKLEVSCNFSQASFFYAFFKGKTGPTGDSVGSKRGKFDGPFNAKIPAKKGETYVIVVSNYQTDAQFGYTIDFSYSTAQIYDNQPPQMNGAYAVFCNDTIVTVRFSENVVCSSVDPEDFKVSGPGGPYNVVDVFSQSCNVGGFYDREYKVVVDKPMPFPSVQYQLDLVGEVEDVCGNFTDIDQSYQYSFTRLYVDLTSESDTVCYNTPVQINARFNGTEPVSYSWSPAGALSCSDCSNPYATITQRTKFKVEMTDANGCVGEDSIVLYVKQLPDLQVTQSNFDICENDTAYLSVSSANKNIIYHWEPPTGLDRIDIPNPIANPSKNTIYKVTITDTVSGCSNSAEIKVNVYTAIQPTINVDGVKDNVSVCTGNVNIIDAGDKDPVSGDAYVKYEWYLDGVLLSENSRYLKIGNSGKYIAIIYNTANCIGRDTINVTLKQSPESVIQYKDTICLGEILNLKSEITKSEGEIDYQWYENTKPIPNSNSGSISVVPANKGRFNYISKLTDRTNGCISYDTVTVDVLDEMSFALDTTTAVCAGRDLEINIKPKGGTPGYNYTWSPSEGIIFPDPNDKSRAILNPTKDTKYQVALEDAAGCITIKSIMVYSLIPECNIKPDDVAYKSTEKSVEIPVRIVSEKGLYSCGPKSAKVTMEVDIPIFNPQFVIADGKRIEIAKTLNKTSRVWNIVFDIPGESIQKSNSTFFSLFGDMILGDLEKGKSKITSVDWGDLNVNAELTEGVISFSNLCNDGNQRLLKYDDLFALISVVPNPAGQEVSVTLDSPADGNQRQIILTDMLGRIVYSEKWTGNKSEENANDRKILKINTSEIKSGMYRLSCCSGMYCESAELMIIH